jgi:hypothetical protein
MCFECDGNDASMSSGVRTFLLCCAIIVFIVLVFVAYRLYQRYAARGEEKDAGQMRWVKVWGTHKHRSPRLVRTKRPH